MPPHALITAGALVALPGSRLDVTDGLVSVGQQAWVDRLVSSVLH